MMKKTQIQPPTFVNPEQVQTALLEMGYSLLDFGNHWRTNAIFRGGSTKTSLMIYKNSGVWVDFSQNSNKRYPFEALVKLTLKEGSKEFLSKLGSIEGPSYRKKELIEMEEVYPESILEKLFPNYNFYTKKGFSESTLKVYKTGLAGAGKMYRRMVFPIYNENKQIVGFSGRKIDDNNEASPKWKHLGKRRNWVYPAYINAEVEEAIKESGEVFLVESIADSMALYESGIKNSLVTFGIGCSSALISYLVSMPITKIYIVGNNDKNEPKNHGYNGAIKILITLSYIFDFCCLEIKQPPNEKNDLCQAFEDGENLVSWKTSSNEGWKENLIPYLKENKEEFISKGYSKLYDNLKND